jgi:ABC-type Na+ efflux pump permease subunit
MDLDEDKHILWLIAMHKQLHILRNLREITLIITLLLVESLVQFIILLFNLGNNA